ncbi:MAG: class I SAM-dependent methyltransferase [Spirochaetes bacterium]|nr:class I SAM-dependent methyltransferase [Spirochaetota bacterium]
MQEWDFYNRYHLKYGRFDNTDNESVHNTNEAEKRFYQLITENSGADKYLLDMGCGDGIFTSLLVDLFDKCTGIEPSGLFAEALTRINQVNSSSLEFCKMDAKQTNFKNESFDIIISRRGPDPVNEIFRLLKPEGKFIFITIGEKDAYKLVNAFGRGQMYGRDGRASEDLKRKFSSNEFIIDSCEDFFYEESYDSIEKLHDFLKRVPIFEDYCKDDFLFLEKYYHENRKSDNSIDLSRHRVVLCASKI